MYSIIVALMVALTVLMDNQNGNSHKAPKQWREDFVKCNILIQNAIVLPRVLMHLSLFHFSRRRKRFKSLGNSSYVFTSAAITFFKGSFFGFFHYRTLFNTASSAAAQIQLCLEDAGIEPRTVVTSALAFRCSNHSARSHPPWFIVK
jgi:hypothetical protein